MNDIWISPSDLSFFWKDTKIGFFDKYKLEIYRPKHAFPSIFNAIDQHMKDSFDKQNAKDVVSTAPDGIFIHEEEKVKSELITIGQYRIGFKGNIDSLIKHNDGTYSLVDYKTTSLKDSLADTYFLQLMAYCMCLSKPMEGPPKKIRSMGLIVFDPKGFIYSHESGLLNGSMHWVEIPIDIPRFKKWIKDELVPLLDSNRDDIEVGWHDNEWKRYIETFYLEKE